MKERLQKMNEHTSKHTSQSHQRRYVGFSVFLHASPIDFNAAAPKRDSVT